MGDPTKQVKDSEQLPEALRPRQRQLDQVDAPERAESEKPDKSSESEKPDKAIESSEKPDKAIESSEKPDKSSESEKPDKSIESQKVDKPTGPEQASEADAKQEAEIASAILEELTKMASEEAWFIPHVPKSGRLSPEKLIAQMKEELRKLNKTRGQSVEYAIRFGGLLALYKRLKLPNGKPLVRHGEWEPLLEREFGMKKRTANDRMFLFHHQDLALKHKEKGITGALAAIREERGIKPTDKRSKEARKERSSALADGEETTVAQVLNRVEYEIQAARNEKEAQPKAKRLRQAQQLVKQAQRVEATSAVPEGVYQFVLNYTSKREYEELVDAVALLQREWGLDSQEAAIYEAVVVNCASWVKANPDTPFERFQDQMRRSPQRLLSRGGAASEAATGSAGDAGTPAQEEGGKT